LAGFKVYDTAVTAGMGNHCGKAATRRYIQAKPEFLVMPSLVIRLIDDLSYRETHEVLGIRIISPDHAAFTQK